jgi:hypothetical protein
MEINSNYRAGAVNMGPAGEKDVRPAPAPTDQASISRSLALESALKQTPESRPSEVRRAQALVDDVHYPPAEGIQKISNLLAMKLASS